MKKFIIVLLAVVVLFSSVLPEQTARADGLTLAAIASGAYAIASASGMDFAFTGYDGLGVSQWMQNRINSWLAGRTVAEAFGSELIRLVAGKLVIPAAAVTGITAFLSDLINRAGLTENSETAKILGVGMVNGQIVYPYESGQAYSEKLYPLTPFTDGGPYPCWGNPVKGVDRFGNNIYTVKAYGLDGTLKQTSIFTESRTKTFLPAGYYIEAGSSNGYVYMYCVFEQLENGTWSYTTTSVTLNDVYWGNTGGAVTGQIPGAYSPPESLNDLQNWEGTVVNAPDTNIEDLLEDIFDQSAAGTLDVTGEVVDSPVEPEVSPVPTAAPGDVIGLDTISGQLEGIDSTLTGVQEGVGEAVGQLEGINEGVGSISEALEVPTASEAPTFKFDLTTLFPFCIPFDIYRFVTMFSASPVAPHVQIPFNIPAVGLQYTFDLDFSSFDGVASVLRSVELIAFCVGLAILTSKVIRW